MKSTAVSKWSRRWLGGALLAAAGLAQAQYVWLDNKGLKQYSDRPPPTTVPYQRILKAPGATPATDAAPEPGPSGADGAPAAAPKAPPTLAERNADFRKRKTEEAEREQKAAEAARRQADIENRCDSLRKSAQMLASGRRIGTTDKAGEQGYMDDAERALQSKKVQRSLAADCK